MNRFRVRSIFENKAAGYCDVNPSYIKDRWTAVLVDEDNGERRKWCAGDLAICSVVAFKTPEQRKVAVVHDQDATLEHLGLLDDPTEWVESQLKRVDPDPFFFDDGLEFREGGTFTHEFTACEGPPVEVTVERRFIVNDGGEVDYNLTAYIDVRSVNFRYELICGKKTLICRATWEW